MKVLANRYLYKFRELLPDSVEADFFDPNQLPGNIHEYDALFVNTTTSVNQKTLPETGKISFIATGSSGNDHIDLDYLKSKKINTANAAGCNARAVAEYVLTALLCVQTTSNIPLGDLKVGLIGVGQTGTQIAQLLSRFSIPHITYDPPKEIRSDDFQSSHFEELKECNVLSFHTPITKSGNYPTYHLLNKSWFQGADYHLLINTSRGEVIDEKLVLNELESGRLRNAVIDVWKDEPGFDKKLAENSFFATPHIAGYSVQSKIRASKMIIDQFCEHFSIPKSNGLPDETKIIDLKDEYTSLDKILQALHPIKAYDESLRNLFNTSDEECAQKFALLRSETPLRYEYTHLKISPEYIDRFPELKILGVNSK